MNTYEEERAMVDALIHETAIGITGFEGHPDAFIERLGIMVRLHADAERGEKLVGHISNEAAVRHVISALCQKTRENGFAVLHGLMREILDRDAVLLDIVDGLYRDLYAVQDIDEITAQERKVLSRVEDILIG
jgi:hypothetical protein